MKLPRSASFCWQIRNHRSRKGSISVARRLKHLKHGSIPWQWIKQGSKHPQGDNGQTFKVNETCENYDAAVHGYTYLLLTPFSFVKLLKKWLMSCNCIKNIESAPGKPLLKSTTPQPHNPAPHPSSLQKRKRGGSARATLKTVPRALK